MNEKAGQLLRRLTLGAITLASINAGISCASDITFSSTGAGGDGSTGVGAGLIACAVDAECAPLDDPCNAGTCARGACVKVPSNEFGTCDDGLFCTENDTCQGGTCSGSKQKSCAGVDDCHTGVCDEPSKSCKSMPGHEGEPCDDDDPCTASGVCSNGVCSQGGSMDCSDLDGPCTVGVCDPQLGCQPMPVNDGSACDDGMASPCSSGSCAMGTCTSIPTNEGGPCSDGFFCTIDDHCENAVCVGGGPNPCPPPGGCYIASCDEVAGMCAVIPGNDGAPCDDFNACTKSTTCFDGACVNGVPDPTHEGLPCDDGSTCTTGEFCSAGFCGGGTSPSLYFADDFHDNTKGWTMDPDWQIGPAMVSFGGSFGADPATDHSLSQDNGVAGVVIGGNATIVDPSNPQHPFWYLTSPPFNTANAVGSVILGFYRWLNSDYAPYMRNTIDVWTGSGWVNLWKSGAAPGIQDSPPIGMGWTFIQHDLTAYKNAGMRIRFGFDIESSGVATIGSWNIDDVKVANSACP